MTFGARGLLSCHSISVHNDVERVFLYRPFASGITPCPGPDGSISWKLPYKAVDWPSLTEEERSALLTSQHELDHFALLVGTPVGLLMWRCDVTLVNDVCHAMRALAELGLSRLPGNKSLLQWFREDANSFFGPLGETRVDTVSKAQETLHHIELVNEFKSIMFGEGSPSCITIGSFLELANLVFPYLSRRWGLKPAPRFCTRNGNLSERLYPESEDGWSGTISEIFEGSARLQERLLLDQVGATPTEIEAWESTQLFDIYRRSYRAFVRSFGSSQTALEFLFISLLTPIDPACSYKDCLYIEDVLPHFRAASLSKAVSLSGMLDDLHVQEMKRQGLADGWCWSAGLELPSEALQSFLSWRSSGVSSSPFFAPILRAHGESDRSENSLYVVRALGMFEQGFRRSRLAISPQSNLSKEADEDAILQHFVWPDIEFFRDTVNLGNHHRGSSVYSYHFGMLHYVLSIVCLSLLEPFRAAEDPSPLISAFCARLSSSLSQESRTFARALRVDENTVEWQELRSWWSDVKSSNARIGLYLREKVGGAGVRSVRFIPDDPGYRRADTAASMVQVSFSSLQEERIEDLFAFTDGSDFQSQINLANRLSELAASQLSVADLAASLAAYRLMINDTTQPRSPIQFATLLSNCARAMAELGVRRADPALLREAVSGFAAALDLLPGEKYPLRWARSKLGRARALAALGRFYGGEDCPTVAVEEFRQVIAALERLDKDEAIVDLQIAKMDLGLALTDASLRVKETGGLKEAEEIFRSLLTQRDRKCEPEKWASAQFRLGIALEMIGDRENNPGALEGSVAALQSALDASSPEQNPFQWVQIKNSLGVALETSGRLEEALDIFQAVAEMTNPHFPALLLVAQRGIDRIRNTITFRRQIP